MVARLHSCDARPVIVNSSELKYAAAQRGNEYVWGRLAAAAVCAPFSMPSGTRPDRGWDVRRWGPNGRNDQRHHLVHRKTWHPGRWQACRDLADDINTPGMQRESGHQRRPTSTAISGPGAGGANHASTNNSVRTNAANAIVGKCDCLNPDANDRTWSMNVSPDTGTPVILPSWLAIITMAIPVMYPTSTGRDSRLARKPTRATPPRTQMAPTSKARTAAKAP